MIYIIKKIITKEMACCECLLVDLVCLRKRSQFEQSIRDEQLYTHLLHAHEIELFYILGTDCLNELCTAKADNTLTDIQLELIQLLEKFITEIVQIRMKIYSSVKFHAAGPVISTPNNAKPLNVANDNLYNSQISYHIRDAKFYQYRINDFLALNASSFTCYPNVFCGCKIKPIYVI